MDGRNEDSPSPSFSEELLPTGPDQVPHELCVAVAALCSPVTEVSAAYICRVRRDEAGSDAKELLSTALEPAAAFGSHDAVPQDANHHLLTALPDPLQPGGLTWLTAIGASAWKEYGIRVFDRGVSTA